MVMKKKYLIVIIVLNVMSIVLAQQLYAVPAAPVYYGLRQPDGTVFHARQWGDEFSHGWETEDGYTIVFDEYLRSWTYAEIDMNGKLVSSFHRVGINGLPHTITKYLKPFQKHSFRIFDETPAYERQPELPQKQIPLEGTANIPAILINFKDRTTTYSTSAFNTLLFDNGNYSLKEYFAEVSYGAFTVSAGPGGIAGWYTAVNNHDYYGQNDASGGDRWPGTLVREAVMAADAAGFNFAPYDQDGDGYVDVVAIIHQGSGEEAGGPSTDIWSHSWSLSGAYYYGYSDGGEYTTNTPNPKGGYIKVNKYIIIPETLWGNLQTIGVFGHEYGHALGLPDLYDTDYSSQGIGRWSLMAGGAWNSVTRSGDRPAHIDAWCKYALGWIVPTHVTATLFDEPIDQAATTADVYQLLDGSPTTGGEYFLVENRQKTGFDAGLPGAGLLIWHVDESISSNRNECYPGGPSCAANHYHVALIQADNLWELEKKYDSGDQGDPYPGSTGTVDFTLSSSPSSNLWNGTISDVSITDIGSSGPVMTATLSVAGLPATTTIQPNSTTSQPGTTTSQPGITTSSSSSTTTSQFSTSTSNLSSSTSSQPGTTSQPATTTGEPGTTTSLSSTTTTSAASTTSIQTSTTIAVVSSTSTTETSTTTSAIITTSILHSTTTISSSGGGGGGGGSRKTTTSSLSLASTSSTQLPETTSTIAMSSSTSTSVQVTTSVVSFTTTTTEKQCPLILLAGEDSEEINLLRDFRDKILSRTHAGRTYIQLFYSHSLELTAIFIKNPGITFYARQVLTIVYPHIKEMVNHNEVTITPRELSSVESLLSEINTVASNELQVRLKELKQDIKKQNLCDTLEIRCTVKSSE
jgi:M6 family metalloprotease-like protein